MELHQRTHGEWTEDAVGFAAVETKLCEIRLQLFHIVPTQMGRGEIEESRAEQPRRLDEQLPRGLRADAISGESATRLKRDQCIGGRIAEETQLDRLSVEQVQRLQAALNTTNRLAALTAG